MEFVVKPKKLNLKMDGKSYEMRFPTIGERRVFFAKLNECPPEKSLDMWIELFAQLGLPVEVSDSMDASDFFSLIDFISDVKKNQTA